MTNLIISNGIDKLTIKEYECIKLELEFNKTEYQKHS